MEVFLLTKVWVFSENAYNNMVVLVFSGTRRSETDSTELSLYVNDKNELFVKMESEDGNFSYLCLDKPTAIRLQKEIRKQISFMEGDVSYGE